MRPRWPRFGLRARVIAAVVLVTTTATAGMAFAAYKLQEDTVLDRMTATAKDAFGQDYSGLWPTFNSFPTDPQWIDKVADRMGPRPGRWALVRRPPGQPFTVVATALVGQFDTNPDRIPIHDTDGALRAVQDSVLVPSSGPAFDSSAIAVDPSTGKKVFVVAGYIFTSDYYLVEIFDFGGLDEDLLALRRKLVYIALGVSVLGVAAALFAARRIRRPVLRVAAAARDLGDGALEVRVPVRGRDELADLAKSFNAMAQRLGESIEDLRAKDRQQRRFVADVAHDLRTPLASMLAAVDNLEGATPAARARAAELLGAQTHRLARLVEDLLEMARFDAGKAELRAEPVDLRALVADAVDVSAPDAGIEVADTGDVTVVADPRRVHTVVCNLLTNAVRHGGEPIAVTLDGTGTEVVVRVADSGAGVPDELLPILFDRFVRGDRARQATAGSGLGLSIARANALFHRGDLTVHNDHGAVFTLTLPRQAQAEGIRNSD